MSLEVQPGGVSGAPPPIAIVPARHKPPQGNDRRVKLQIDQNLEREEKNLRWKFRGKKS